MEAFIFEEQSWSVIALVSTEATMKIISYSRQTASGSLREIT